jgi:hypothetical protein
MEQKIYDTKTFPFANVDLGKPFHKNGMYFIKMYVSGSPIYIQPPKCFLKQGILKTGKKLFCDLVFSIEDDYFLSWLEKIEDIAKTSIFENRKSWFETELDEHDIEQSLVSPYKMYKSGKCFVIRTNIPTTLDKCDLKIYDENENEIAHEDLKDDTNVITIIELKGIKCSARNFQFIFDVRQMLVIKPVKIFEKCIIKPGSVSNNQNKVENATTNSMIVNEPVQSSKTTTFQPKENEIIYDDKSSTPASLGIPQTPLLEESSHDFTANENTSENNRPLNLGKSDPKLLESNTQSNTRSDLLPTAIRPGVNSTPVSEICEIDFDLAEISNSDTVQIKPRNDVYYRMYKSAKQKAKEAKLVALSSYLEAKRIKTTYSLVDSSDEDSMNDEGETNAENDSGSEF